MEPKQNLLVTGIPLANVRYQERDVIVWMLTESMGKLTGIARNGVQSKRFAGTLDRFTASDFNLDQKSLRLSEFADDLIFGIQSGNIKRSFSGLAKDMDRMAHAGFILEICQRGLPAQRPFPEIYRLLGNALDLIENSETDRLTEITTHFVFKFLVALGTQPLMTRCQGCHLQIQECSGDSVKFEPTFGGWKCANCVGKESGLNLSRDLICNWLPQVAESIRNTTQTQKTETLPILENLIRHLIFHVAGFEKHAIKSLPFILGHRGQFNLTSG